MGFGGFCRFGPVSAENRGRQVSLPLAELQHLLKFVNDARPSAFGPVVVVFRRRFSFTGSCWRYLEKGVFWRKLAMTHWETHSGGSF